MRLDKGWRTVVTLSAVGVTLAMAWHHMPDDMPARLEQLLGVYSAAAIVMAFLAMRGCQAAALSLSVRYWGGRLRLPQSFGLVALKGFFNQGVSGSGLVAQGVRARYRLGVAWGHFGAATLLQAASMVVVLGGLLAATGALLLTDGQRVAAVLLGLGAAASPIIMALAWGRLPHHAIRRRVPRWPEGLGRVVLSRRGVILHTMGLALVQLLFVLLRFCRLAIIAVLMQPDISLAHLFVIVLMADLATVVPITPAGIGVRELVIALGGAAVGDLDVALAAAIIDRVASMGLSLLHGLLVLVWYHWSDTRAARQSAH